MRQSFDSLPLLVRRRYTATLQRTTALEWEAQVSHGAHLFCVIAAAVVARNVANQEVLIAAGPTVLGKLYLTVALVAGAVVAAIGWLGRTSEARPLARVIHVLTALGMAGAYMLPGNAAYAVAKYIAMDLFFAAMLLAFGVCLGAQFEPREARRVAARVGLGGILGGLLAGMLLSFGAPLLGSDKLYLMSAALAAAPVFWLPRSRHRSQQAQVHAVRGRPDVPALVPYGFWVAVCTFLMVASTTLIDYQFRYAAEGWFDADDITSFFGFVVLMAGCTTIVFQLSVLDKLLDRAGLFSTASIMPVALILSGAAFGVIPTLATLVALKLVDSGTNMSLQQATGNLLLAPLSMRARAVWQGRIDGIAKRGAQAASGVFLAAFPWPPSRVLPLVLGLCSLWLVAMAMTRIRYVQMLTQMLSSKPKASPEVWVYDESTGKALAAELDTADSARAVVILQLLTQFQYPVPLELLHKVATQDGSGTAVTAVMEHLAALRDVRGLLHLTHSPRVDIALCALSVLAEVVPARAEPRCRELLANDAAHKVLQSFAAALLADTEPAAAKMAQELATSKDVNVRLAVAEGLGRTNPSEPLIGLILAELARDPRLPVATAAFASMHNHPSKEACQVALEAMAKHTLRNAASRTLAAFGPPVIPVLAAELQEHLHQPRHAAGLAWTLGRIASAACVPPLLKALTASHVEMRLAAAVALTSIKRRNPTAPLSQSTLARHCAAELRHAAVMRRARQAVAPRSSASRLLRRLLHQRAQASLETAFRLLALQYPPSIMHGAFMALHSSNKAQQQLALELLDTVLEAEMRALLQRAIGGNSDQDKARDGALHHGKELQALWQFDDPFLIGLLRAVDQGTAGLSSDLGNSLQEGAMSEQQIQEILQLQSVSIFSEISPEDLAEIAGLMRQVSVKGGTVLYREGDVPDGLYVIHEGMVGLTRAGRHVEQLGPGDVCGVVAVLDRMPRELTATALASCRLGVLSADDLWPLMMDRPILVHSMFRALTYAIRGQIRRAAIGKRTDEQV